MQYLLLVLISLSLNQTGKFVCLSVLTKLLKKVQTALTPRVALMMPPPTRTASTTGSSFAVSTCFDVVGLNKLEPNWQIRMFERLDQVAQESSNGFNNAGTGHSGFRQQEQHQLLAHLLQFQLVLTLLV
jgi:hypothetical protein